MFQHTHGKSLNSLHLTQCQYHMSLRMESMLRKRENAPHTFILRLMILGRTLFLGKGEGVVFLLSRPSTEPGLQCFLNE